MYVCTDGVTFSCYPTNDARYKCMANRIEGSCPAANVSSAVDAAAAAACTGMSAGLQADDCLAWRAFFDAAHGSDWQPVRTQCANDPCACVGTAMCTGDRISSIIVPYLPPTFTPSPTIPTEIGLLTGLTTLALSNSSFAGTIPTEIGKLTAVTSLELWANNLEGTIPTEMGSMSKLIKAFLYKNKLTGTIPSSLGNNALMFALSVSYNQLTGTVPVELNTPQLHNVYVDCNHLEGGVPDYFCSSKDPDFSDETSTGLCWVQTPPFDKKFGNTSTCSASEHNFNPTPPIETGCPAVSMCYDWPKQN